jgi:hypothetical protein
MVRLAAFILLLLVGTQAARAEDESATYGLRWIQLSDRVVPVGGTADRAGDQWVAHGTRDGVAYRFSSDSRFFDVSGQQGLAWRALDWQNSWQIACHVVLPIEDRRCSILRVMAVDPSGQKIGGLQFKRNEVCVVSDIVTRKLEIRIDGAAPLIFEGRDDYCLKGETGEQFTRDLLNATAVAIKGYFVRPAPVVEISLSSYGLRQALVLRDWISEQFAAKRLQAAPE